MPVVIAKPNPEFKPVDLSAQPAPPPAPPVAPGLSRADVEAMLAARDAVWERRLAALALTLAPQPAEPRKGASISFTRNTKGEITGAAIVPKE